MNKTRLDYKNEEEKNKIVESLKEKGIKALVIHEITGGESGYINY